jgi:colanic acid/amylovoran biosynthesis glycosyltransferase
LRTVLVLTERMLPSTQTFIPVQVDALTRYRAKYVGLVPAARNYPLPDNVIRLSSSLNKLTLARRELYKWTGIAPQFHAQIRASKPSLIHAHFPETAPAALFLANQLNIPFILHLRGGLEIRPDEFIRRRPSYLPYLLFRRRLWQRASLFLSVSGFIRNKAISNGYPEDRTRIHYTGINLERFEANADISKIDPNMVIYVGRLTPYKGADHLIKALSEVRKVHPATHLVIIGDGEMRADLERQCREESVPCNFLGEQPGSVIREWLERARVFCGPSRTLDFGMSEAFGNVFTDAQAMGVPVVSYRHGGIPETMIEGESGLLAEENDIPALAGHLLRYLQDDAFWQHSRERGMAFVRDNFDVQKQTLALESIYDQVVTTHEHALLTRKR